MSDAVAVSHLSTKVPRDIAIAEPADRVRGIETRGAGIASAVMSSVWSAFFVAIIFAVACVLYVLAAGVPALFEMFFGRDAGDLVAQFHLGQIVGMLLLFVMVTATMLTVAERKWSAMMQDRIGPNRARLPIPFLKNRPLRGIPHIAADVLKMLTKEDFLPVRANALLFNLAPVLAFAPAFALVMVVPFGPEVELFGRHVPLQIASVDPGLLVLLATASLAVYGTALAGWSSNNKFALLGGLRASAQLISYEVTLGLTLVGVIILFGTLRLDEMVLQQGVTYAQALRGREDLLFGVLPPWGVLFQPLAFLLYFTAAGAEIKRAPFDLPEAESEIIGYFIEYSGLKFGMFMIAEFVEVVVISATFVVIFFGGWHLPWAEPWLAQHLTATPFALVQVTFFLLKVIFFCWLQLLIRWSLPRFRYDQLMHLGWKVLLPLSLGNVLLTGFLQLYGGREALAWAGLVEWMILLGLVFWNVKPSAVPAAAAHGDHA